MLHSISVWIFCHTLFFLSSIFTSTYCHIALPAWTLHLSGRFYFFFSFLLHHLKSIEGAYIEKINAFKAYKCPIYMWIKHPKITLWAFASVPLIGSSLIFWWEGRVNQLFILPLLSCKRGSDGCREQRNWGRKERFYGCYLKRRGSIEAHRMKHLNRFSIPNWSFSLDHLSKDLYTVNLACIIDVRLLRLRYCRTYSREIWSCIHLPLMIQMLTLHFICEQLYNVSLFLIFLFRSPVFQVFTSSYGPVRKR